MTKLKQQLLNDLIEHNYQIQPRPIDGLILDQATKTIQLSFEKHPQAKLDFDDQIMLTIPIPKSFLHQIQNQNLKPTTLINQLLQNYFDQKSH